jgi:nitroimidazol reductase NimA-like FMN-containing flavoprotein (pyridoxamine 5'-phosphate oxidase superfamily)
MWQDERSLVVLSRPECLALLRSDRVGRVVFSERALPAVLPVSYAVLGEDIVLATTSGSRLAHAALGGVLAFEVDHLDPDTRTGWSVVVTGLAVQVIEPVEQSRVRSVLDSWAPGRLDLLLRLPSTVVTGRRIEADVATVTATIG